MQATRARPAGRGWEWFCWLYMRISAVVMIGLVLGHLYFMHIVNSTDTISHEFVSQRLATPFWRIYDLVILLFAMSHGVIGTRGIIEDYVRKPGLRRGLQWTLYVLSAAFTIAGIYVLVAFQPGQLSR
ncbi:MAG: succinate dehydrogenase, hydrophobic membrane anchor protein [Armatimonadetes bacterium]|nr:succinate dehydrogenase, hydrophobic membrane anchor protein [Armatimonadota bacterium]